MSDYSEFFLNSRSSIVQLDCIEISHSKMTQNYYVVRNATRGVTVTHEDSTTHNYEYYPIRCSRAKSSNNLDHVMRFEFGDLGTVLPPEVDAIRAADGLDEFPVVRYRTFRSDMLTTVLFGPLVLEIKDFAFRRDGAMFEAKAPSLNVKRTGERMTLARFPMLRGVL